MIEPCGGLDVKTVTSKPRWRNSSAQDLKTPDAAETSGEKTRLTMATFILSDKKVSNQFLEDCTIRFVGKGTGGFVRGLLKASNLVNG